VAPSVAPIAARVGVAAGLATIAPPLAILPFIDLGNTPDVDCRRVLGAPDNASVPVKDENQDNTVSESRGGPPTAKGAGSMADRQARPAPARGG